VDGQRVLRRRRGPLQLALGGVLVVLVLVVEVLILQAYVNVNRSTAIFGKVTFLSGNLVNVQREALLLNVQIEELPTTHDVHTVQVRRALLGNQLYLLEGLGHPPGRPGLPGRAGLPLRPPAGRPGHDRAAGQDGGRRRVLPPGGQPVGSLSEVP
jgi:hypothetical protein